MQCWNEDNFLFLWIYVYLFLLLNQWKTNVIYEVWEGEIACLPHLSSLFCVYESEPRLHILSRFIRYHWKWLLDRKCAFSGFLSSQKNLCWFTQRFMAKILGAKNPWSEVLVINIVDSTLIYLATYSLVLAIVFWITEKKLIFKLLWELHSESKNLLML